MKYAIISDIHSNLIALNLAIEDALMKNVDHFIFLGDYITDGIYDNEVLDLIKEKATFVVKGNREEYILNIDKSRFDYINYQPLKTTLEELNESNHKYLKTMKDSISTTINNHKVLMIHGHKDFENLVKEYDFDICLYGHTHNYTLEVLNNKIFINPGSIGQPADGENYKYVIFDFETLEHELIEFPIKETFKKIEEEYKKSKYYQKHQEWGNLILITIRDGFDYVVPFFTLLHSYPTNNMNAKEFNKHFKKTYNNYLSDKK